MLLEVLVASCGVPHITMELVLLDKHTQWNGRSQQVVVLDVHEDFHMVIWGWIYFVVIISSSIM